MVYLLNKISLIPALGRLYTSNHDSTSMKISLFITILYITSALLGMNVGYCRRVEYHIDIGPRNITRRAGEVNVFIPCPFVIGDHSIIWIIDSLQYFSENYYMRLSKYNITSTPYGLFIPILTTEMNGTTFQCIERKGSLIIRRSKNGTLYVLL